MKTPSICFIYLHDISNIESVTRINFTELFLTLYISDTLHTSARKYVCLLVSVIHCVHNIYLGRRQKMKKKNHRDCINVNYFSDIERLEQIISWRARKNSIAESKLRSSLSLLHR